MQGVSSYYTAEARELTNLIRTKQKESQMEMFLEANRDISSNKLDLHFLQIGDAVKNLSLFVAEKQSKLIKGQAEFVEIVTGKGTRSDNGKSRLKPAVQGWLDQKKLPYTEVNPGCLKVQITSSSS